MKSGNSGLSRVDAQSLACARQLVRQLLDAATNLFSVGSKGWLSIISTRKSFSAECRAAGSASRYPTPPPTGPARPSHPAAKSDRLRPRHRADHRQVALPRKRGNGGAVSPRVGRDRGSACGRRPRNERRARAASRRCRNLAKALRSLRQARQMIRPKSRLACGRDQRIVVAP